MLIFQQHKGVGRVIPTRHPPELGAKSRDFVFSKRPLLKTLFQENRQKNLRQFAADNLKSISVPADSSRRNELLESCQKIIEKRLGSDTARGLRDQLQKGYFASTADHHTSLNMALPICSNILLGEGMKEVFSGDRYVLVLSCSSVSQNNEDFPRGLLFHEKENGVFVQKRAALLPSKNRNSVVYGFRPWNEQEVLEAQKEIPANRNDIAGILEDYRAQEVLESESLCEQITKVNFRLWPKLFPRAAAIPIYLEFEELASQLLQDHHLGRDSVIFKLMFDDSYGEILKKLVKDFEDFVRQGSAETHFFWGLSPEKNYRLRLMLEGGKLMTAERDFSVPWNADSLAEALRKKMVMPNMFLVFLVLHLYYGLNCFGGFNQIHYLDAMERTYQKSGIDPLSPKTNSVLFHYGLQFLFLKDDHGEVLPINGPDVSCFGQEGWWQELGRFLDTASWESVFDQSCSIYYKVLS